MWGILILAVFLAFPAGSATAPVVLPDVSPPAAAPVSADPYPITDIFAGMPPPRLMGNRAMTVSFGTLSHCGKPPPGKRFVGCVRGPLVHMGNPCEFGHEQFARIMCHEMAHVNGWPRTHGP